MRTLVNEQGLSEKINVDSAGTGGWHVGEPPHAGTRERLVREGISFEGIFARKLTSDDIQKFDYIIGMDKENLRDMHTYCKPEELAKTYMMADFVPNCGWKSGRDVPDPWYTGDFDETYLLLREGCEQLLVHLKNSGL